MNVLVNYEVKFTQVLQCAKKCSTFRILCLNHSLFQDHFKYYFKYFRIKEVNVFSVLPTVIKVQWQLLSNCYFAYFNDLILLRKIFSLNNWQHWLHNSVSFFLFYFVLRVFSRLSLVENSTDKHSILPNSDKWTSI